MTTINDRYVLKERIAQGGMSEIFLATDKQLNRQVAIKFTRADIQDKQKLLKRFSREAEALSLLSHPNIVKIHDYGQVNGNPFIVMSYFGHGTLESDLNRVYSYQNAAKKLIPVAEALQYAHQKGIVHRDLKPSNILITDNDDLVLSDFGIVKFYEAEMTSTLTKQGHAIGTPEYMAPEQAAGQEADPRADIYALGIILYELITGKKPFTGNTPFDILQKHIKEALPDPRQYIPDLPQQVIDVLNKALAKKAEDRFQNIGEMLDALHKLESDSLAQISLPPSKPPIQPDTVSKKKNFPKILIGVALAAIVVFAVVFFMNRNPEAKEIAAMSQNTQTLTVTPLPPTVTYTPSSTNTPAPTNTPTSEPTPTLGIGSTIISESDGMEMVYVPEGTFLMGASDENIADYLEICGPACDANSNFSDEQPQHEVYLDAFWMDKTEVTNAMYQQCVYEGSCPEPIAEMQQSGHRTSYYGDPDFDNYPFVRAAYDNFNRWEGSLHPFYGNAQSYCQWAGKRLPTEAEWEKAARGTDERLYPWGNQPPTCELANTNGCFEDTTEAGFFPAGASPYGVLDMLGNVAEWVEDLYIAEYYSTSPFENPLNEEPSSPTQTNYMLRGGSYASDYSVDVLSSRSYSDSIGTPRITERMSVNLGFNIDPRWPFGIRCVMDAENPEE